MIICLFFWQFFDHPVIIDFLTERWYGGYQNRKLSRLWWFLLTVWCLFDIVLFPLIFLLTRVIGKVFYLHEFDDISLNVDSQIFHMNDCGPWIYKAFLINVLVLVNSCLVLFSFHSCLVFVFVFSFRNLSRQLNAQYLAFLFWTSVLINTFSFCLNSEIIWLVLLMTRTSERLSCFNSSTNSNFISFTSQFFLFKNFKQLHL